MRCSDLSSLISSEECLSTIPASSVIGQPMKIFVNILITIAALSLGGVALAQEKAHVVTGRVVSIEADGTGMLVQVGKKSLSLGIPKTKNTQTPKVGDTVRVNYTAPEFHARYDPDGMATKIEVVAGSKR